MEFLAGVLVGILLAAGIAFLEFRRAFRKLRKADPEIPRMEPHSPKIQAAYRDAKGRLVVVELEDPNPNVPEYDR